MKFAVGQPDMIRAINQRWLLNFWKRSLNDQNVPLWRTVEAEDFSRLSANLSFLDVAGSDDNARYQIRFNGATIAKVYGKTDCRGKFLDEIIPQARYPEAQAPYRQAVQSACPVYTIHDVTDRDGRVVHYERLLLPFASDGDTVDRILASFEFVCLDGAFEGHELMKTPAGPPVLQLSATIEMRPGGVTP
jgi:hypothetical protein